MRVLAEQLLYQNFAQANDPAGYAGQARPTIFITLEAIIGNQALVVLHLHNVRRF